VGEPVGYSGSVHMVEVREEVQIRMRKTGS
jgi:hypothetical protein